MRTRHYPPILLIALGLLFSINLHAAVTVGLTTKTSTTSKDAATGETYTGAEKLTVTRSKGSATSEYLNGDKGMNYGSATNNYSVMCYKNGTSYSSFQTEQYIGYSVTVAEGYTFSISSLEALMYASANITYKVAIEDVNGNELYSATTTPSNYKSQTNGFGITNTSLASNADLQNLKGTFYVKAYFCCSSTGKYLCFPKLQLTGDVVVAAAKSQWDKPTFAQGDYNGESLTYPVTISSEEGTTITYAVGTGAEQTTTTNSVTIDVAPLTSIKATASGEGYDVSEQATFTTAATPAVATPTLTIGSYDYINGGYPVTPSCATDGATLTYTVSGAEPMECESGKPLYAVNTTVSVTAAKKGYVSATSEEVTLYIAPTDDYSIPFQVKTDTYDKDKDHEYISYTIPGTYIAGINNADSKNNLKFRSNKASLTMVNGSTIANAIEIKVNEGYVIDKLYLKDFKANRDGIITISHVYVDGVEKTFAEMGRTDESITMNASGGAYTTAKAFSNLNATRSIIIELTNGTYGSGSPVDQFRAAIQTEYHSATLTLGQNGYSTFAADYDYTFTGAQAYKAAYDDATSTVSLTEITGTVPANEGIIFKGTEGETVTITKSVLPGEELTGNSLTGVTASTEAFLPGTNYVLASNGTATAFVKMATDKQVADMIGKAYLNIPSSGATPVAFYINATPTGVTAVEKAEENIDAPAYNIVGQRVASSAKGLVIIGGRKFINK